MRFLLVVGVDLEQKKFMCRARRKENINKLKGMARKGMVFRCQQGTCLSFMDLGHLIHLW
jgi:hypothetical protein